MKKLLGLVLVLFITNVPIGCVLDDCGNSAPKNSKIKELSASVGSVQSGAFVGEKSTSFNKATIEVVIEDLVLSQTRYNHNSIGFVNQAFACSPPLPTLTHKVESIAVTGDEAVSFNGESFSAGTDLSDLFVVRSSGNISFQEYINALNQQPNQFSDVGQSMLLQLASNPDAAINQVLKFTFKFDDGATVEAVTMDLFEVEP